MRNDDVPLELYLGRVERSREKVIATPKRLVLYDHKLFHTEVWSTPSLRWLNHARRPGLSRPRAPCARCNVLRTPPGSVWPTLRRIPANAAAFSFLSWLAATISFSARGCANRVSYKDSLFVYMCRCDRSTYNVIFCNFSHLHCSLSTAVLKDLLEVPSCHGS